MNNNEGEMMDVQECGTINEWVITRRLIGSPESYYVAKKNGSVHTSKKYDYIVKIAKSR